jgi:hypothetical protein
MAPPESLSSHRQHRRRLAAGTAPPERNTEATAMAQRCKHARERGTMRRGEKGARRGVTTGQKGKVEFKVRHCRMPHAAQSQHSTAARQT